MAATPDEPRAPRVTQRENPRATMPSRRPAGAADRDGVRVPAPRQGVSGGTGPPRPRAKRAPLPLAAAVTTAWAAVLSAAPVAAVVVLSQLADAPRGSVVATLRYGLAGWLLAHGVPLRTGLGPLEIAPLAVTALAAWRVARAGLHTVRALGGRGSGSPRIALSAAVAVAVVYGLLGAAAAVLAHGPGLAIDPIRAGLTLTGFGLLGALTGTLATTGVLAALSRRLPGVLPEGLRTGTVATLLVLAVGATLVGLSLALAGDDATDTLGSYRAGIAGQAGLTLVCLAYAPNLAAWSASYLLGPGFAVGADTAVRTSEVSVGALPALPVFAGLPSGPLAETNGLLVGAPVAAGMVAGWLLARRRLRRDPGWLPLLGAAAIAGPVAGVLLGLSAWASGGSLGAGRLAVVGPVWWQVGLAGAGSALVGAVIGAAATRAVIGRAARPPA